MARKKKHTPGSNSYFTVSGLRLERILDEQDPSIIRTKEHPFKIRFASISLRDAENFATDVYKKEAIVCEIHEVTREAPSP